MVQVEDTEEAERLGARVFAPSTPGTNVRAAGEDVRRGQAVLSRGDVIGPAEIGVMASLGYSRGSRAPTSAGG